MYKFTNSWPHLSRTDSAVGKPKITTMQIFTRDAQCMNIMSMDLTPAKGNPLWMP